MATLFIVEDHARVGGALLKKEEFSCDSDALIRVRELLDEEDGRRRGVLPLLYTLWIECDDGSFMSNKAIRCESRGFSTHRVVGKMAVELETLG